MQAIIYRMDEQQSPAVEHRERCSVSCDEPQWKRIWRESICVHIYNWVIWLHSRNEHIVNQLCGGLVAKSCLALVTLWTVALQAPLSMEISRKNTGVRCHFLLQKINYTSIKNQRYFSKINPTSAKNYPVCVTKTFHINDLVQETSDC